MKIFTVFCVVFVAALLENVFAKSSSQEQCNQDISPEDAIRLVLYYRNNNTEFSYDSRAFDIKDMETMHGDSRFQITRETTFYFHCMEQSIMNRSLSSIAAASMLENRFNFVMVDWTYYMNGQRDFENMPDFKHVAATIAPYFVRFIQMGWSAPKFHMLGNGVGANLAAAIARKIVKLYPSTGTRPFQVEKITALDPFMPTNYPCGRIERLNLDDANIVDIIHTSSLSSEYFGNVNFYPNGGRDQPGCDGRSCSHNRAWEYYAESAGKSRFYSMACRSWEDFKNKNCGAGALHTNMGMEMDNRVTGNFFLYTNDHTPFSKSMTNLKSIKSSNKSKSVSSSSSSSSSDESNDLSGKKKNRNSRNRSSNESIKINKIRENMQRNKSSDRNQSKSNERKNKGRNSNERRQNNWN